MNESPKKPEDAAFIARLQYLALAGVLLALGLGAWILTGHGGGSGLPRYGTVPDFSLVGTDARPFDSAQLKGKIWVASFVFTSCKNSCPMLTAQIRRLSKSLPEGADYAMVSFSVDPKKDTPEVLRQYATALGADDPRWHFVTGTVPALKSLIQGGFMLSADPSEVALDERGSPDIVHSSKIVLVDRDFVIRGYYDGLLGASVEAIQRDAKRLAKEKSKA